MRRLFILAVQGYRLIVSPVLPPSCKYHPTCSHYAIEAFERHGVFYGLWLAAGRILRCNPFAKGGFDPVP
ncbi:MAG: membrane protein insertion efficiency factor YidD [Nitrospinae bacterium]|nr:membrane protein insertion efficiency factor YidD [Nitrospinota bacterium]